MSDAAAMVEEWAAAWTAHDAQRLAELFTEDCVHEDVTLGVINRGRDKVGAFTAGYFGPIPDLTLVIGSSFATGDRVAAEWTMTGTQTGDLPAGPATGKSFIVRGFSLFVVRDGLFSRATDYWDRLTLLRQLGHAS